MAKTKAVNTKSQADRKADLKAKRNAAAIAKDPVGSTGTLDAQGHFVLDPPGKSVYED